jgi:hypothetical protein
MHAPLHFQVRQAGPPSLPKSPAMPPALSCRLHAHAHTRAHTHAHIHTPLSSQDWTLPPNVTATTSAAEAITGAQYAIHAVPVQHTRAFLSSIKVWVGGVEGWACG